MPFDIVEPFLVLQKAHQDLLLGPLPLPPKPQDFILRPQFSSYMLIKPQLLHIPNLLEVENFLARRKIAKFEKRSFRADKPRGQGHALQFGHLTGCVRNCD